MMKQHSHERTGAVAHQLNESLSNNLKSYITDLKKVATTNKQKRGNGNMQAAASYYRPGTNFPGTTKNLNNSQAHGLQMAFVNSPSGGSSKALKVQAEMSQDMLN